MTLSPIDAATALRLLRKQVDSAGPDYVYGAGNSDSGPEVCQYVIGGAPSCLIGRALADYGVPLDVLSGWDNPSREINEVYLKLNPGFLTRESASVFSAAQDEQDRGKLWRVALDAAEDTLAELMAGRGL